MKKNKNNSNRKLVSRKDFIKKNCEWLRRIYIVPVMYWVEKICRAK